MTKDKYTGGYRLGLNSIFVPKTSPFKNINTYNYNNTYTQYSYCIYINTYNYMSTYTWYTYNYNYMSIYLNLINEYLF